MYVYYCLVMFLFLTTRAGKMIACGPPMTAKEGFAYFRSAVMEAINETKIGFVQIAGPIALQSSSSQSVAQARARGAFESRKPCSCSLRYLNV